MAPGRWGQDWRERATRARERHLEAEHLYRQTRERYLEAVATSVQLRLIIEHRRARRASGGVALADRAVAAALTLMALRPKVDGRTAEVVDAAITACEDTARYAAALAGQDDSTYLWLDDLREIEEMVSAIYAHVNAGAGQPRQTGHS